MTREAAIAGRIVAGSGMTVRQLMQALSRSSPDDIVKVYERGSVYDIPVISVRKEWKGEQGVTCIVGGHV